MLRYAPYLASLALFLLSVSMVAIGHAAWGWGLATAAALLAVGTADLLQKTSTLRRNYPILAHFRYGLESIGPEMRQYFIESDTAEVPFSRQQRALVYQRSKSVTDTRPFGSQHDAYADDYEWINHSIAPTFIESHDFRVLVFCSRSAVPSTSSAPKMARPQLHASWPAATIDRLSRASARLRR